MTYSYFHNKPPVPGWGANENFSPHLLPVAYGPFSRHGIDSPRAHPRGIDPKSLYYDTVGNADGTGVGLYEAGFWQSYRTHGPLRPSAYDRSQVFANVDGRQWLGGSYPRVIGYDAPYIHRGKYPGGTRRRHSLSGPALHGSYPSYHTPLPYGDARRSPYICGPEKYTETPIYGPVGSHLTYPAPGATVPEPVVPPLLSWGR